MRRWTLLAVALVAGCSGSAPLPSVTAVGPTAGESPATVSSASQESVSTVQGDERAEQRHTMIKDHLEARDITDPIVLGAMQAVPRHRFVPDRVVDLAYADHALPIGHGQTISQPYIVGMMSQALRVEPGDKVLEIGTGSGYQAAVLAAMGCEVYTMEIIPELAERATATLTELGYGVTVANADGYHGWEDHAPFDGIIVTAAPDHIPQPLIEQLGQGAALVIPIGPIGAAQTMWRFTVEDELLSGENLGGVIFVPFTRSPE